MSFEILGGEPHDESTDMYSLGMTLFTILTGGRSVMLASEIQKDKDLFTTLQTEIVKERGHDQSLFDLFVQLVDFDPKKRPTPKQTIKIIKSLLKAQIQDDIPLKDALKSFHLMSKDVKIEILSWLELSDIGRVMRVSKNMNSLCQEEDLWKNICFAELGEMNSIQDFKILKKKQPTRKTEKSETETWKKYMLRYVDFQGRSLERRKKDTLGKLIISEMHPDVLDEAAIVLAKAMLLNPCFNYVFSGWKDDKKISALAFVMIEYIKLGVKLGRVYVASKHDKYNKSQVIGVAIWNTPWNFDLITGWRKMKTLTSPVLQQCGLLTFHRLVTYFEAMEKIHLEHAKKDHAWILVLVGVLPECQSHGVGTNLISPVLKKADKMNLPCILIATEQKSLKFFTRLGFTSQKIVKSQTLGVLSVLKRQDEIFIHEN